jgi:hypothetical protein
MRSRRKVQDHLAVEDQILHQLKDEKNGDVRGAARGLNRSFLTLIALLSDQEMNLIL